MKNNYQDSIFDQKCIEDSIEDSTINFFKDRNINKNMLKEFIKSDKISHLKNEPSTSNRANNSNHIDINNHQNDFEIENSMINYAKKPQENLDDSLFQVNPKHLKEPKPNKDKSNTFLNNESMSKRDKTVNVSNTQSDIIDNSNRKESSSDNFDISVVYRYNEMLKYPSKYGLWYIYHPRANSSFGPLSSDEIIEYYKKGRIHSESKIRLIDLFNFMDKSPFSFITISELEEQIDLVIPNSLMRFMRNLKMNNGLKSILNFDAEAEEEKKRDIVLKNEIFEEKERSWDEKYIPVRENNTKQQPKKNKKKKGKTNQKIIEPEKNEITIIKNNENSAFVSESVLNIMNRNPPIQEVIIENILDSIDEEEWTEVGKKKPQKEEKNKLVGLKEKQKKYEDGKGGMSNTKVMKSDLAEILKKKAETKNNQLNQLKNNYNNMEEPLQKKGTKSKLVEMDVKLSKNYIKVDPAFSILGENIYKVESKKSKK